MSWFPELRRRNVFRVAAAYAIVAWLVVQIADIVFPALQMPEWALGFVTLILGLGFPVALVMAWAYELTPEGIRRADEAEPDPGAAGRRSWRLDPLLVTLVAAAVAFIAADTFLLDRRDRGIPSPGTDSPVRTAVAVLPFESLGGDGEQQIFVDGLVDDLIARLSSWRSVPVIARAASFNPDLPTEMRAMSELLDARYVVEGSVRRSGAQLRIVVRLVDAVTGQSVWSEQYDRPVGEVLSLQDEISSRIVGRLNPALLNAESERARRADPRNVDAWTAAYRGWWHVNRETADAYAEAREWLERAIELDPDWGWPHAALALTHYRELLNGWSASREDAAAALTEHAETAVNLDAMDSFAHHALGHAYATMGRSEESLASLARGVELNPSDAMASSCYGMQLAGVDRGSEAVEYAMRAMTLSPRDPWEHRFTLVLARGHFAEAEYADSERWADRSLQLRPSAGALWHSVSAAALGGAVERATRKASDARAAGPLVPIDRIRAGLSASTVAEYVDRLIEGLTLASYDTEP